MKNYSLLFLVCFIFSFLKLPAQNDVTLTVIDDYNSSGWTALKIDNGIIELLIVPEIGGRVLFYGFSSDEFMAVNEGQFGENYDPDSDNYGPWSGDWGYGGYKVWPAPQSKWNWPPPPHLCWGNYTYDIEHNTSDSVVIFLESEEETTFASGLVFERRFKAYSNSTKVIVEQTIINNNSTSENWSIWEVTQAVVQHGTDGDYTNFNVYFPASKQDIWHDNGGIFDDVTQIETNLSKYQYDGTSGKFFTYLENDGWACFTDERDEQSYAKVFEVLEGTHADDGANFEVYAGGGYIEIEVLSPIVELAANGGNYVYNEEWYAASIKGTIYNVNKAGAVSKRLSYDAGDLSFSGEFGLYNTGSVKLIVYGGSDEIIFNSDPISVIAGEKFSLDEKYSGNVSPVKATIVAYDNQDNEISVLATWEKGSSTIRPEFTDLEFNIYPSIAKENGFLFINTNLNKADYSIVNLNGIVLQKGIIGDGLNEILLSEIKAGTYIIRLKTERKVIHQRKVIVLPY